MKPEANLWMRFCDEVSFDGIGIDIARGATEREIARGSYPLPFFVLSAMDSVYVWHTVSYVQAPSIPVPMYEAARAVMKEYSKVRIDVIDFNDRTVATMHMWEAVK